MPDIERDTLIDLHGPYSQVVADYDCQSAFKRDPQSASNFDPSCTG
jgi:hypothetical protein